MYDFQLSTTIAHMVSYITYQATNIISTSSKGSEMIHAMFSGHNKMKYKATTKTKRNQLLGYLKILTESTIQLERNTKGVYSENNND